MTQVNNVSFGQAYNLHCRDQKQVDEITHKLHGTKITKENEIFFIPQQDWEVMQNIAKASAETRFGDNDYCNIYHFRMNALINNAKDKAIDIMV